MVFRLIILFALYTGTGRERSCISCFYYNFVQNNLCILQLKEIPHRINLKILLRVILCLDSKLFTKCFGQVKGPSALHVNLPTVLASRSVRPLHARRSQIKSKEWTFPGSQLPVDNSRFGRVPADSCWVNPVSRKTGKSKPGGSTSRQVLGGDRRPLTTGPTDSSRQTFRGQLYSPLLF